MNLIGWDIGGTKCAAVLGMYDDESRDLKIVCRESFPTPSSWESALGKLMDISHSILRKTRPDAVGISCGGPLDTSNGIIQSPPNLPGWTDVPVVRYAREAFGVPVYLENDANACALAEWKFGAGRGSHSCVFLTFGTGLGAGIILMDRLWRGANGNAGECGHIRLSHFGPAGYGKPGSFEGYCSGGGIAQLAETVGKAYIQSGKGKPAYDIPGASAKQVAEAAEAGDLAALEVMSICGEMLGSGISVIVDILNPEVIVIGSIYVRAGHLLEPHMNKVLKREALSNALTAVSIRPAELGESTGDMAALSTAVYGLKEAQTL